MYIKDLAVSIDIDTKDTHRYLDIMQNVRDKLETQLSLNVFSSSSVKHLFPITEISMRGDEYRKQVITDVLRVFDSACIEESLKTVKTRMLPHEIVSH